MEECIDSYCLDDFTTLVDITPQKLAHLPDKD